MIVFVLVVNQSCTYDYIKVDPIIYSTSIHQLTWIWAYLHCIYIDINPVLYHYPKSYTVDTVNMNTMK